MSQPITQEDIAKVRKYAPTVIAGVYVSDILDALTASLAEAQRLAEIVDIRKAARESLVEALKLQEIGAMMDLHVGDNIATRILPWMLAKDEEVSRLRDELARRDAVRVELTRDDLYNACEWHDMSEDESQDLDLDGTTSNLNKLHAARLVPAPPQADAVVVPKSAHDCGDCVQLAVCTGALACACGPTGKMFIRALAAGGEG